MSDRIIRYDWYVNGRYFTSTRAKVPFYGRLVAYRWRWRHRVTLAKALTRMSRRLEP